MQFTLTRQAKSYSKSKRPPRWNRDGTFSFLIIFDILFFRALPSNTLFKKITEKILASPSVLFSCHFYSAGISRKERFGDASAVTFLCSGRDKSVRWSHKFSVFLFVAHLTIVTKLESRIDGCIEAGWLLIHLAKHFFWVYIGKKYVFWHLERVVQVLF